VGRASTLATYKARRPNVVLGITGCMAEHLRDQVRARAPFVDLVVGRTATVAFSLTSKRRAPA